VNWFSSLINRFFPIDDYGRVNIMGFLIYTDDLLIVAILFFLYLENVDDLFLYIVLILLLIS